MMQRTLGEELHDFTQTLYDFAEQDRREIHQAIINYLRQLDLSYMALFVQIKNRRENVLTSVQEWSYNSLRNNQTDDLDAKDQKKGQVRYAFLEICDLWIVSKDENSLEGSKNYIDLFNNIKEDPNDIPRYDNSVIEGQKPVYTSIIIIIRDLRGNPFGAVNFEFSKYIGYDNELSNELYRIAKAIGILHSLEEIHVNQKN